MRRSPVIKDLVLVGGGHSHVAVLRSFGMHPLAGVRVTLVSRGTLTPYSGMLPGLIAGRYTVDEAHIDLVPLCRFSAARFIKGEVTGVDTESRTIEIANRPPLAYDVVSIDCGSTPSTRGIADPDGALIPVKPIDRFLARFEALLARLDERSDATKIAVVGGGVGGVELTLAIAATLEARMRTKGSPLSRLTLLTDKPDVTIEHPPHVRERLRRRLAERGVDVITDARVTSFHGGLLGTAGGQEHAVDEVLCVTNAAAPEWIRQSGLAVDGAGFLLVNGALQSVSHDDVFGAGDAATMRDTPRPKSGVFAVRQGRPLASNLRRALLGEPLVRYRPQREFLRLIGTGDGAAVAVRGPWSAEGRWVWRWKDWIDRRFMHRFQVLPEMDPDAPEPSLPRVLAQVLEPADRDGGMRCGGCGAKVGADVLAAALAGIGHASRDDVVVGLEAPDDAAIVAVPAGRLAVLSVDAFRPMIEDPYLFGRITANHCLNDLYAMGAEPQSAMTVATLPVWPEDKLVAELKQMLAGALEVFDEAGAALVGGHTSEGAETSLGFSVTGLIEREAWLAKASAREGDHLVLTKALGTGTILAADMRAKARGTWVDAALASMLQSNRAASDVLRDHSASACTDVTGFGLLGHLLEMTRDARLGATLDLDRLPVLEGALETARAGHLSTLHPRNARAAAGALPDDAPEERAAYPLLFDPQTAGGLLAAVPAEHSTACVEALDRAGYASSAIIGRICRAEPETPSITFGSMEV